MYTGSDKKCLDNTDVFHVQCTTLTKCPKYAIKLSNYIQSASLITCNKLRLLWQPSCHATKLFNPSQLLNSCLFAHFRQQKHSCKY